MPNPVITLILDAKNLASPQLKSLQRDLKAAETNTQKMGAAMDRSGMLLKGMVAAGAIGAVYGLANALADGVQGAIAEEAGIARLTTALKANVPAWDGSTAAIEKTIKARTDLAFADDELRDSLAVLVPATRNVSKAFDVQRVAMDLARLKGISLQEASEALVKVEAGQFRMLKSLGIVLKDGATQTEALAEVQRVAAGQAEEYAEKTAGKLERLEIAWGELSETVGGAAVPAIEDAADALTGLATAMDFLQEPTEEGTDGFLDFVSAAASFGPMAGIVRPGIEDMRTELRKFGDQAGDGADKAEWLASRAVLVAGRFEEDLSPAMRDSARRANLATRQYAAMNRELSEMDQVARIAAAALDVWGIAVKGAGPWGRRGLESIGAAARGTASGGWRGLNGPELLMVGEAGPEYVVPNHDIAAPMGTRGGMGGGGVTLVVNSAWPPSPAQAREFADMLDAEWAQRRPRYSPA